MLHLFFYMSGATTIGYTSIYESWLEDDMSFDMQSVISLILTFNGIMLMAIMEAYFTFALLEELRPLMWAQNNIQYLNKLLRKELFKQMDTNSHNPNEYQYYLLMSDQLVHTFSYAVDIRWNQSALHQLYSIFPSYEPLSMWTLLQLASRVEKVNRNQMDRLLYCGNSIVLMPGFALFCKGDLPCN